MLFALRLVPEKTLSTTNKNILINLLTDCKGSSFVRFFLQLKKNIEGKEITLSVKESLLLAKK